MPSRNIYKVDAADSYYHVYARGVGKMLIFTEHADFAFFLDLFGRYLLPESKCDKSGVPYPHLFGKVRLLAYCLMGNHFHLLVHQVEPQAMSALMKCVMTSYSRYFNFRHKRCGPLFESRYKASMITEQAYLQHISRYIHLNSRYWKRYPYSSLQYYLRGNEPEWLEPSHILELFASSQDYMDFVADYESHKVMFDEIKYILSDR